MPGGENMAMAMRHDLRIGLSGTDLFPAHNRWNIDLLRRHRGKFLRQSLSLGCAWRVGARRLIDRRRNSITTHDSRPPLTSLCEERDQATRRGLSKEILCFSDITRIGTGLLRINHSETDPMKKRSTPLREWLPITMRSGCSVAIVSSINA